jgi:hypothetical protein
MENKFTQIILDFKRMVEDGGTIVEGIYKRNIIIEISDFLQVCFKSFFDANRLII